MTIGCCFFGAVFAEAYQTIPEDNLKYSVLLQGENVDASGFLVKQAEGIWLVTAKHVLFRGGQLINPSITIRAYTNSPGFSEFTTLKIPLDVLWARKLVRTHGVYDIAVVKIADKRGEGEARLVDGILAIGKIPKSSMVGASLATAKKYDGVLISNDVYIFGYPSSIGLASNPQIDYTRPLLRKGIIAGKNENKRSIILDCPSYYGNSGGPVVQIEETGPGTYEFRLIGVLIEFIPFEEEWLNLKHRYINKNIENSGYSVVAPVDGVIELVSPNWIGDDKRIVKVKSPGRK